MSTTGLDDISPQLRRDPAALGATASSPTSDGGRAEYVEPFRRLWTLWLAR